MTSTQPRPSLPVLTSLMAWALPLLDDEELGHAGEADDRLDGDDGGLGLRVGDDRGPGQPAGPEQSALVGDQRLDLERPAGRVDRRADPRDPPLERHVGMRRDGEPHELADAHLVERAFGDLGPEPQRVLDHQLRDRIALLEDLPLGDLALGRCRR